jgi:N-acetylmuramoyl-L-alanine amidase
MTMATLIRLSRFVVRAGLPAATLAVLCALPAQASAQSAATLYQRAQAREESARAGAAPAPDTLRSIAQAYENIVRRFPISGYTDNALWQAAGLMALAFERTGAAADRDRAIHYLEWLRDEYPHSSLVRTARARIDELRQTPRARPADAASPPPAAPPDDDARTNGAAAVIRSVTREAIPRGDRLTIELSREVSYSGDRVDSPDRLFFDFATAEPAATLEDLAAELEGTLVKGFRVGRHPDRVTRVVFELDGTPRHSAFLLYDPFRLVVDLESSAVPSRTPATRSAVPAPFPTAGATLPPPPPAPAMPPTAVVVSEPASSAPPAATVAGVDAVDAGPPADVAAPPVVDPVDAPAPPEPAASTSRGDYSLARQLGLGVSRIVIDPGHGGHDPGAQAHGVVEAELVLDIAKRLETLLAAHPGVEVLLTRDDDRFIPLEERTTFANREGADLFLSIHANASRQASTRGVETYVLNFATTEAAEAVAARENATSARSMGTLPDILKTIAMNDKLAESRELASMVQTALVRSLRTQSAGVRDLGVKQAPFVVLIGAEMPSVLAEVSFLTNKPEAALLKTADYRQRIAQALHDALVKYQSSLKKITTVAAGNESR